MAAPEGTDRSLCAHRGWPTEVVIEAYRSDAQAPLPPAPVGGTGKYYPAMAPIDHVMVVVADLDDAAERYESQHGLMSFAGGPHMGMGTANVIVPLGDDYIELIAVVDPDEAARNPVGQYLSQHLAAEGEGVVAVCLRTTDGTDVAKRTGSSPVAMSRTLPDGREIRWGLIGMEGALMHGLPFFITWRLGNDHPGRIPVEHPSGARGIAWAEVGGDPDRVRTWVGSDDRQLRLVGGQPGIRRFAVATAAAEITLS